MTPWSFPTSLAKVLLLTLMGSVLIGNRATASTESIKADVVVYGATPSGIAAAISAASGKHKVLLVEPTPRIGGLTTNGLSHTDFRTFESLNGTFLDFTKRIEAYYAKKHGPKSQQVKDCRRGTHSEPHVNLRVFEQMLANAKSITIRKRSVLKSLEVDKAKRRITKVRFVTKKGVLTIEAKVFVDATYEGDLMAMAGVPYRVGRESRDKYGESLAPKKADKQVQGYNFRLTMTKDPKERVPPTKPKGYRREDFLGVLPLLRSKKLKSVFCRTSGGIYKAQKPSLPNNKYDINDVSRGLVRLSLPSINDAWPDGDLATRQAIFEAHLRHNVGLLYFLQTDKAVPVRYQKEARQWGLCRNEFEDNDHLPHYLYVREARRMVGRYVFTERDTECAAGDARAVFRRDAIAMGDYGLNCHGTAHAGPRFGGRHEGEFYKHVAPYQIPYGVLTPKRMRNLLVPVAASSSHVGFCGLRLEPIWTSLGQAAGFAARKAVERNVSVQDVSVSAVQKHMRQAGAAVIYVSDVLPGSKDFQAVQWWGSLGGLHGLSPRVGKAGQRGKHIEGQYFEAFPGHAAELKRALDAKLRNRWLRLLPANAGKIQALQQAKTRGEFIRLAYRRFGNS